MSYTPSYCDMHSHSTVSDGTLSPAELAQHAAECGLKALALTDHDTTLGATVCQNSCESLGVRFVPGIEITCDPESVPGIEDARSLLKKQHEKSLPNEARNDNSEDGLPPLGVLHILGLFIDPDNQALTQIGERMREARHARNPKILEKLRGLGIEIEDQDLDRLAEAHGVSVLSRPHIGQILMEKGYVDSIDQAFDRYLKRGKPAYVPRRMISAEDAIDAIHQAGGVAMFAHPPQLRMGVEDILHGIIETLKRLGLHGVEAWHPCHTGPQSEKIERMTRDLEMLLTGGSDYHGHRKNIALGCQRVPFEVYENLKQASLASV